jgi:two-component system chemotaxis response regulator CheB
MGECINIIPIFATDYVRMVIKNDVSVQKTVFFKNAVKNIRELRIELLSSQDVVVLACVSKDNIEQVKELAEFLEKRKIPAIAISDNSSLQYEVMRAGFLGVINYIPSDSPAEQKMLISQIRLKAHDAVKIHNVIKKRSVISFENVIDRRSTFNGGGDGYRAKANEYISFSENEKSVERENTPVKKEDTANTPVVFKEENLTESHFDCSAPIDTIIVIGASTGGTEALIEILKRLPAEIPPILIVQHMPAGFTKMYADRCDYFCKMKVQEATEGMVVHNGNAYIAPGEHHMRLNKGGRLYYLTCRKGEKVNGVCPSVDVLFDSVSEVMPKNTIGIILTGMGMDGADGLLKLKNKGAYTIGQNEKTCVVYGMPKEAFDRGAVEVQANIEDIAKIILENV